VPDPITPGRAARILASAAAVDNREPSAAADEMWARALTEAGVGFDDCMAAVVTHYARSAERLMPAHVIVLAREAARERAARERTREAIEAAERPGALPPGELHARLGEAITAARRDRPARDPAARHDKNVHPSGDDGFDGTAWYPGDDDEVAGE